MYLIHQRKVIDPQKKLDYILKNSPDLLRKLWQLFHQISLEVLTPNSRVYGGSLQKLEPKELRNVPAKKNLEIISA